MGRNGWKVFIKLEVRDFPLVPVHMQDIVVKITESGNMNIDSPWIKGSVILQEFQVGTDFLIGDGGEGSSGKIFLHPLDIRSQI